MTQTLEYNPQNSTITLNTYTADEFIEKSIDITDEAISLVIEKLMNDYDLDEDGELVIKRNIHKIKSPFKHKIE